MLESLDQDIRDHIERETQVNIERGMPPEEAHYAALRKFGNVRRVREETREVWSLVWLEQLQQDVRYGLRTLRKSPGFTAVAILTLALGIGANTAIFSVAYAVLFRPLPYPHSSRLVDLEEGFKLPGGTATGPLSMVMSQVAPDQHQIFDAAAAYRIERLTLTGQSAPNYLLGTSVSGDFFSLLGIQPLFGRPILPQDSQPGREQVAVLGYTVWQNLFGGDPAIVGRRIVLNGKLNKVVGVMPPRFEFPSDDWGGDTLHGIWIASQPLLEKPAAGEPPAEMYVVARLKPGVTLADANAQLHTLAMRLVAGHAYDSEHLADLRASSVDSSIGFRARPGLLILLGAVGFVLLIACVNVSALLLARSWTRRGEVAIRVALGASRSRLTRQLLTESVLLSAAGGAAGLLFSVWGMRLIRLIAPPRTPRIDQLGLDATVLWFTLGVSILAGILFGVFPALHLSAHRMGAALNGSGPGSPSGSSERRPHLLRNALVIVEVALAVVLVMGGALMARSLEKLAHLKLGLRTDNVLTMGVNFSKSVCPPGDKPTDRCLAALNETIRRVEAAPGVESAAISEEPPLDSGIVSGWHLRVNGGPIVSRSSNIGEFKISPDYFRTMEIRLLEGRTFGPEDTSNGPPVVVINNSFAQHYLSGNPLGQHIGFAPDAAQQPKWMEIVGVAENSRDLDFYSEPTPSCYMPFTQELFGATLLVRTSGDPMFLLPAIKQRVWSVDKDAPLTQIRTMKQVISDVEAEPHFHMALLGSFGALGLLLAMIGTYGVISYTVVQRTHEIGVRIALGAGPRDVLRLVLKEGILLAGGGIAIGVASSLALTSLIRGFLFEVTPTDPPTFAGVAILLLLVALLACYVPARRAMRVDPMVALRYE